ncbi:MAG: SDR family NAD(P)-dependent oxidoreductase [Myxococcaceae bacterium]|nr:SDR family NAD(P)-dependent oxidoreductase [Myxococcaceae bacterium]
MSEQLRFDGRVAIVTGAGNGLGRSHALLLASRGAKVVVNDLGGSHTGSGRSSEAADRVVAEIKAAGGKAVANYDSVEDGAKIVQTALDTWKRVDIVINNAGILRDTSFRKMTPEDWELIYRVHVNGAFRVTHAAWPYMQEAGYGRILFTASAAGIYGNFGQANYSMAKLGLVGFANTLAIEGAKKNIRVNTIAPIAGSRMTETVLPKELVDALKPEYVSPLVAWLVHESCEETGGLFEVGGGFMAKLRWERTKGRTWRLGAPITPEKVRADFAQITDFANATHPSDINAALEPVMENVNAPPSKGGNEFIDVDAALGWQMPEITSTHDERDMALYALGVGAAKDPLDARELPLVYELHGDGFKALPTYAVNPVIAGVLKLSAEGRNAPGLNYGLDRILHGEQYTEVFRPFPAKATLKHKGRIKDIFDKGKHALVISAIDTFDAETGERIAYNEITTFVRGAGGWGGDRGPNTDVPVPDRAPDVVVTEKTSDNQALLYRLSGDWNPLHADPEFAQAFGFPRPILHGLCTFGFVGRQAIRAFAPNADPRYFKCIRVRFADSVFPGETLQTEMWKESDTRVLIRTKVLEREKVVINNAFVEFYKEIPRGETKRAPAPAPARAATTAPSAPAGPSSAAIFQVIGAYVAKHPELVKSIHNVYHFKLKNPASEWTLDLKNGAGSVTAGAPAKADCVLELEDSDWVAIATGKADANKLYFGKKLKISGNVMASQKLDFLRKIDPAEAAALVGTAGATPPGTGTPASSTPAEPAREPQAPAIFRALQERLAANPKLAAEVNAVVLFKVTAPDGVWTVDLKEAPGVKSGAVGTPTTTFTISDEDLLTLVKDPQSARWLYQHGQLRVDGDISVAHRLGFLKQLV